MLCNAVDSELIQDQPAYSKGILLLIDIISYSLWKADVRKLPCMFVSFSESALFITATRCLLTFWTHNPGDGYWHLGDGEVLLTMQLKTSEPSNSNSLYLWLESPSKLCKTWVSCVPVWVPSNSHMISFKAAPKSWYFWVSPSFPHWSFNLTFFWFKQFYSSWSIAWLRQQMEARVNPA